MNLMKNSIELKTSRAISVEISDQLSQFFSYVLKKRLATIEAISRIGKTIAVMIMYTYILRILSFYFYDFRAFFM